MSWIKYNTMTFCDVYEDVDDFLSDYSTVAIPQMITNENATTLYYLLYARYGNNPIANNDLNQFKYKLFSIIFQYGATWEKKLRIQSDLRNLTLDDLQKGTTSIYNHANNPETSPSTQDTTELTYVNDQNVSKIIKNKSSAYAELMGLLEEDVTGYFLDRFKRLFKLVSAPECVYIYEEEE